MGSRTAHSLVKLLEKQEPAFARRRDKAVMQNVSMRIIEET
jgi:hypothetical protein